MKAVFILSALLFLTAGSGHSAEVPTVEFRDLSDREISRWGKKAFVYQEGEWQHAETEHFIYHFTDPREAETIFVHAEGYYRWIKDFFNIKEDTWSKKAHIYVFSDKALWSEFKKSIGSKIEGNAFTTGAELFIYRTSSWIGPKKTLAHELTHVILYRFLKGSVPLFLNEGFAEYVSLKAVSVQFGGDEYRVRTLQLIPERQFLPLNRLLKMTSYPSQNLDIFYRQSELLTRFLIVEFGAQRFYQLLQRASQEADFSDLLDEIYGLDFDDFEAKFKASAITQ